ncbi:MAG: GntR family transcriptional regulator [Firmicutes bacterium]|nr:GntR family transcriptional regulator [Bacillota bacterium]
MEESIVTTARYQEIAYEIAKKIVSGEMVEGSKLSGRSLISSEYNVSSETVRKAMRILSNYSVVEVKERVGIYVSSKESALRFIDHYKNQISSNELYNEIHILLESSKKVNHELQKKFKKLIHTSKNNVFPFEYFTYEILEGDRYLGQTFESLNFQEKTKGLVFAIEDDGVIYQAPDSKFIMREHLILYILGDKEIEKETINFFD